MTKGESSSTPKPMPRDFRKFCSLSTFHTLLNTLLTDTISQMSIHTKESILTKPKSPDSAVVRILSAAFIKALISFSLLTLA